jgi:DinB superfamily
MEASEKQELLTCLADGCQALLDALDGITEEQAKRTPAPGCWSVLECVEHVAVVEAYLFTRLIDGRKVEETGINPAREGLIAQRGADRSRKVPAPEGARPTGRYATVPAALQAFLDARERTIAYLEACDEDLRAKLTTHPLLGATNCHETVLMIGLHPKRHAGQIREIRAAATLRDSTA